MSEGPARDGRAELDRILGELLALRRREVELLERLRAWLARSRGEPPVEDLPGSGAALPPETRGAGRPEPVPGGDRAWLDEAVDAALRRAFSGAGSAEEADEEESPVSATTLAAPVPAASTPAASAPTAPAPAAPAPAAAATAAARLDPDLLLLQSGDIRAAFPWDQVQEIGLADEVLEGPPGASLQQFLNGDGGALAQEPYRISWETPDGAAALTCEALGAVVPASVAASRGVELVLLPGTRAGAAPCRVLTLVDYLVTLQAALSAEAAEEEAPEPPAAGTEPPRPEATAAPAVEEAPWPEAAVPVARDTPRAEAPVAPPVIAHGRAPLEEEPPSVPALSQPEPEVPDERAAQLPEVRAGAPAPETGPVAEYPRGAALVAVRYLPARVAISRVLRSLGWQAVPAPDNQELPSILRQSRYEIVFAEPPDPADRSWLESLARVREGGGRVVLVASRVRGAASERLRALGDVPRLWHPFREGEIQRALRSLYGQDPA